MASSKGRWTVDNWQIPVPLGDCSVHLLIDNKPKRIINAFIMDGGKASDDLTAEEQILRALKAIDAHHWDPNTTKELWKFDAWVVTHWDHDHYAGVQILWNTNRMVRRPGYTRDLPFREAYFKTSKGKKPRLYCGGTKPTNIHIEAPGFEIIGPDNNQLLGLDLFTGDHVFNQAGNALTIIGGQPRFCVVGANGVVVGKPNTVYMEDKKKGVSKNESSILAVVYWPGESGRGRTSYFTGGDGNPAAEVDGLVPVLKNNEARGSFSLPQTPVNMVKLDHHGSSKENLADPTLTNTLLQRLQPVNLLVTPGNQYGHPTWDVLYFLFDYIMGRRRQPGGAQSMLFTTRSPYWLNTEGGSGLNVGHAGLLDALFRKHLGLEDADDDNEQDNISYQRSLAELGEVMKKTAKEYKREMKEFKAELPIYVPRKATKQTGVALKKTTKKTKKDDKPYWWVISNVSAHLKDLRKKTAEANRGAKGSEEPELTSFQQANLELRQLQDMIRDMLRDLWGKICKQELIISGNPYWLIHFWFENSGADTHVAYLDDDGTAPKPIEHMPAEEYGKRELLPNIKAIIAAEERNTWEYVKQNLKAMDLHSRLALVDIRVPLVAAKSVQHVGGASGKSKTTTIPLHSKSGRSGDNNNNNNNNNNNRAASSQNPHPLFASSTPHTATPSTDLNSPHWHTIPNSGEGLLCGIFALHDSLAHQLPAITNNTPAPSEELLYHIALKGRAAQILRRILPNEINTRNFSADHLASILYEWGRSAHLPRPLQLAVVRTDNNNNNNNNQALVFPLPAGETRQPRRIWIAHAGDGTGEGGHYTGIAAGAAGGGNGGGVTKNLKKGGKGLSDRMVLVEKKERDGVQALLEALARENWYKVLQLSQGYRNPVTKEEWAEWNKKKEEEEEKRKKKMEEEKSTKKGATKKGEGQRKKKGQMELEDDEEEKEQTKQKGKQQQKGRGTVKHRLKKQPAGDMEEEDKDDEDHQGSEEDALGDESDDIDDKDSYIEEEKIDLIGYPREFTWKILDGMASAVEEREQTESEGNEGKKAKDQALQGQRGNPRSGKGTRTVGKKTQAKATKQSQRTSDTKKKQEPKPVTDLLVKRGKTRKQLEEESEEEPEPEEEEGESDGKIEEEKPTGSVKRATRGSRKYLKK